MSVELKVRMQEHEFLKKKLEWAKNSDRKNDSNVSSWGGEIGEEF